MKLIQSWFDVSADWICHLNKFVDQNVAFVTERSTVALTACNMLHLSKQNRPKFFFIYSCYWKTSSALTGFTDCLTKLTLTKTCFKITNTSHKCINKFKVYLSFLQTSLGFFNVCNVCPDLLKSILHCWCNKVNIKVNIKLIRKLIYLSVAFVSHVAWCSVNKNRSICSKAKILHCEL